MRSNIFSGPVRVFGKTSRFGSARGPRVEGCNEYEVARGDFATGVFSSASVLSFDGDGTFRCGIAGGLYCDIPAATAVLVWTHLKYGLECMTILRFFLGRCSPSLLLMSAFEASSLRKSTCARSASLAVSSSSLSR